MIIRKQFKFEGAHIVRNAVSKRCAYSIHGHSYIVEVFLHGNVDQSNGMLLDFIEMKNCGIANLIDNFDHALVLWSGDSTEYIKDMMNWSQRIVIMNVNPTAENMAIVFHHHIQKIIDDNFIGVNVKCVRVHETATGYAESELSDIENFKDSFEIKVLD